MVFRLDHVSLPFNRTRGFGATSAFWTELGMGLKIIPYAYDDVRVDHAGTAERYRICAGQDMVFSYVATDIPELEIRRTMERLGHIGIELDTERLLTLFDHPGYKNATRWGPGYLSVFIEGPCGLRLEFLARNALISEEELKHRVVRADAHR